MTSLVRGQVLIQQDQLASSERNLAPSETEVLALKCGLKSRCMSLDDALRLGQRQDWSDRQRQRNLTLWAALSLKGCGAAMDEKLFAALVARWLDEARRLKQQHACKR